jgi:outer membrane protein assembly complex protein YaeT
MIRVRSAALLLLLLSAGAAAGAAPLEDLIGRPIVSITIDVEGVRTSEPALVELVELRAGDRLAARAVRDTIAHLFNLGRFEDVRVFADEVEGGVAVRVELVPLHAVGRIEFEGTLGLGKGQLRRAVSERFGLTPDAARTADVVKLLESVYRDSGYLNAHIRAETAVEHRREQTTLTFHIEAGPRVTVREVRYEGNAPGTLQAARRELGFAEGQPYDRRRVESRLADYVGGLRERGYYEARADHALEEVSPDRRSAVLVVNLDGGPHISIVFEGDPVSQNVRDDLVPIEREGSVDQDLLEDSARRIASYFHAQGYRDADVTFRPTPRDGELAIVFRVTRGPQYQVGRVEVSGNASVPLADLAALMRLEPGQPFLDAQLDADVAAVTQAYRRRGFVDAAVTSAVLPEPGSTGPVAVLVRVVVNEGARSVIGDITFSGNTALSDLSLREMLASRPGQPFYQPQVALDRDGIVLRYLNLGYTNAAVDVRVRFADDRTRADLDFEVHEGTQVFVDHVLIVGNEKTSASTVRREITLQPGDPLAYDAVAESQRRISALGLFRRVRVTDVEHGVEGRRDLLVTVEEGPATTIGYGGGVEVGRRLVRPTEDAVPTERFEFAPRGFFEIGRRNLFGRNRSVNLFTRVSLRLRSDPVVTEDGVQPRTDFNEYRVLGTYRQPRLFGANDFMLTGFAEQGARTSFDFNRRGVRAQLARRFTQTLSGSARYSLDRTEVFNETYAAEDQLLIDRLFPQVRLSTVSSLLIRDTRDDPLGPSSGALIGWDTEVAGRAIGSEVGFVKSFVQGHVYRRLPGRRGVVFATGARLGLAAGFARDVPLLDEDGNPVAGPGGETLMVTVDDLPASERFFAGGDTTVRGFALDQLGTPETLDDNGFPKGGNAVIVLNAELRVPIWGDLGAVAFLDGGNVFARVDDFSIGEIRGAAGFGLRYRSPIGPLRLDLGFKLDRQLLPNGEQERATALHISLGQAF